jgi:hypothetical protein
LRKNATVMNMAETWHDATDGQRHGGVNGVRWAALVGYGYGTPGQIREYTGSCLTWTGYKSCPKRDETPVDGDGTVAVMSAAIGDPWRATLLNSGAQLWYLQRGHGDLVKRDYTLGVTTGDGPALQWIGDLLRGTLAMTSSAVSSTQTVDPAMSAALASVESTAQRAPENTNVERGPRNKLAGAWIAALGPVSLQVQDVDGRATGRARGQASAATEIPDSNYEQLPGSGFVFVKRDGAYTINLTAEEAGSTDLKVRVLGNGKVERTAVYLGIKLNANGRAQLAVKRGTGRAASPAGWPALQIDADGDGVFETSMSPSAVLDATAGADMTPPELAVEAPAATRTVPSSTTIRWRAADGGAGLSFEQATLDPDTPAARQVANGETVALPAGEHRLLVVAVDRAGNATSREISFAVQ